MSKPLFYYVDLTRYGGPPSVALVCPRLCLDLNYLKTVL